jgi:choline dehydrogenase-like flavoprotein
LSAHPFIPQAPADTEWDVAVVGTGMGGATIGHELARLGRRVLFIEKGLFLHDPHADPRALAPVPDGDDEDPHTRLRGGHWPHRLQGSTSFGTLDFYAPVGCGTGGTTNLYAAALERLAPADFRPRANFPDVTDSSLPTAWPISFEELLPFYARAEALYRVRGTADPLARGTGAPALLDPPPLSPRDRHLFDSFEQQGLHPYRVHVGCEYVDGCTECAPHRCMKGCKSDAGRICIVPALVQYGAKILPECEALRLEADATSVKEVWCRRDGKEFAIRAKIVVLAAGAYMTPAILLRSTSDAWPDGLANRSGLVGRNLMFHIADFIAVTPVKRLSGKGPRKTMAFNDLYVSGGHKLGTFQSVGTAVNPGQIMRFIRDMAEKDRRWWTRLARPKPDWWRKLSSPLVRLIALVVFHVFNVKNATIWAAIIEDLPYHDNRIVADPRATNGMRFEYRYTEELNARVKLFRRRLTDLLGRHNVIPLYSENNINFGHVCGTCRFGDDPAASVLDRNNRAHDLSNLYVVDASFFPSSGGTNPSLTIAANALRVAEAVHRQLKAVSAVVEGADAV